MSVSLVLLPIGLAMYAIMGKKNFDAWVDSMQVKIPTRLTDEGELSLCIRKAGYDAEPWGGMVKTHLKGESSFFFWQKIDGKWAAVFAKSIPQTDIKAVIRAIESSAGRSVFEWAEESKRVTVLKTQMFPTNFRDREKLVAVLNEYSLQPQQSSNGDLSCRIGSGRLVFKQEATQPFTVQVSQVPNLTEVFDSLGQINERYCQVVQADTCSKVKARISEAGMQLESEEVLPDNTIVLTLTMP